MGENQAGGGQHRVVPDGPADPARQLRVSDVWTAPALRQSHRRESQSHSGGRTWVKLANLMSYQGFDVHCAVEVRALCL